MLYLPNLENISTFVLVAKMGSFTRAAKTLEISTNATSRRVMELEAEMGVRLLFRTTRSLSTTEEGRILLSLAEKSVNDLIAARDFVQHRKENIKGLVRVGVPSVMVSKSLLSAVNLTFTKYPGLNIQIMISDGILDQIREEVDLSIEPGPLSNTDRIARPLGELEWKLAASESYAQKNGLPKSISDLENHFCLPFVGKRKQKQWALKASNGKIASVHIKRVFESNDSRVLRQAIYEGLGIGPLSQGELSLGLKSGALRAVLPDYSFAEASEMFAVFHRGSDQIPRNRVVLELLIEACKKEIF